jgi:hypothetical protein
LQHEVLTVAEGVDGVGLFVGGCVQQELRE